MKINKNSSKKGNTGSSGSRGNDDYVTFMTRGTGAFQEEETRPANSCARIVCVNCYESMHMNSIQLTVNSSSQGPQAKKRGLNYLKLNEVCIVQNTTKFVLLRARVQVKIVLCVVMHISKREHWT